MSVTRRWFLLVVAALLVATATPAQTQKLIPLRIAVHTAVIGAADVIAIRQGFYKQEGLDVEWRRFALGKDGRDAMIAGALDVNATATTPSPAANAATRWSNRQTSMRSPGTIRVTLPSLSLPTQTAPSA